MEKIGLVVLLIVAPFNGSRYSNNLGSTILLFYFLIAGIVLAINLFLTTLKYRKTVQLFKFGIPIWAEVIKIEQIPYYRFRYKLKVTIEYSCFGQMRQEKLFLPFGQEIDEKAALHSKIMILVDRDFPFRHVAYHDGYLGVQGWRRQL